MGGWIISRFYVVRNFYISGESFERMINQYKNENGCSDSKEVSVGLLRKDLSSLGGKAVR
jgi:hypothetical protein